MFKVLLGTRGSIKKVIFLFINSLTKIILWVLTTLQVLPSRGLNLAKRLLQLSYKSEYYTCFKNTEAS